MSSKIDIYNLALYKLAQSIGVPTIADNSKAADVLTRLWEPTRDLVLTERVWPWSVRAIILALTAEDPQVGWSYRYAYPSDCLSAYAITTAPSLSAAGSALRFTEPRYVESVWGSAAFEWETSYGEQGTCINSNTAAAVLVYGVRVEEPERFPPQFVNALACRLAAEAGPPLIGEVGLNSKSQLMQEYERALTNAGAHSMNEASSAGTYVTGALAARGCYSQPGVI